MKTTLEIKTYCLEKKKSSHFPLIFIIMQLTSSTLQSTNNAVCIYYMEHHLVDMAFLPGTSSFSLLGRYHVCSHRVHISKAFSALTAFSDNSTKQHTLHLMQYARGTEALCGIKNPLFYKEFRNTNVPGESQKLHSSSNINFKPDM